MPGWSNATLSSADTDALAADKPLILADNILWGLDTDQLYWSDDGTGRDATGTDTGDELEGRVCDHFTHIGTTSDTDTTVYLVAEIPDGNSFDSFGIIGHSLGGVASGPHTVTLEIADTADFSGALTVGSLSFPTGDTRRRFDYNITDGAGSPTSYQKWTASGECFLRVAIAWGAGSNAATLNEVWIGSRLQMLQKPLIQYNDIGADVGVVDHVSRTGIRSRYSLRTGLRTLNAQFNPADTTAHQLFKDFQTQSLYGTKPFIWAEEPNTDPDRSYLMWLENLGWEFPWVGPNERVITLEATEQGGVYYAGEIE